ncbi:MAG: hypothetical protein V4695_03900 [Pseudomonadota bacterium]
MNMRINAACAATKNGMDKAIGESTNQASPLKNADLKEVMTNIVQGKEASPRLKVLQENTSAYMKKNLGKVKGSREIVPGQFTTGFRQVNLVEKDSFVRPEGWEFKQDINDFEKSIYEASLQALEVGPDEMPANCDVITLENVLSGKPPNDGKPLDPQVPLHGTDGYGNHVFVLPAGHSGLPTLDLDIDKSHEPAKDCSSDPQSGARAAWLSAFMQVSATQLRKRLEAQSCDKATTDRLCALLDSYPEDKKEESITALASVLASGGKLEYPNGMHGGECLGEDLRVLTMALIKPSEGKAILNKDGGISNAQMLLMLNRLGATCVINGEVEVDQEGKKGRNFIVSSGTIHKSAADIAKALPDQQAQEIFNIAANVPVIFDNGSGRYAIRFAKQGAGVRGEPEADSTAAGDAATAEAESEAAKKNKLLEEANATAAATATAAAEVETPEAVKDAEIAAAKVTEAKAEAMEADAKVATAKAAAQQNDGSVQSTGPKPEPEAEPARAKEAFAPEAKADANAQILEEAPAAAEQDNRPGQPSAFEPVIKSVSTTANSLRNALNTNFR